MPASNHSLRPALFVVALAACLLRACPALASWSTSGVLRGSVALGVHASGSSALSVNGAGEAALVWRRFSQRGRSPHWWYDSSVSVALVSRDGRARERTIWARSHTLIAGVSDALSAAGEMTVAWVEEPSPAGGRITVRSIRRSRGGRWSPAQSVAGGGTAFFYARPALAVAPDGRVLLAWNAGSSLGARAAWHEPGRAFAPATAIGARMLEPTPVFDAAGVAHVYGIVDCDAASSRGELVSAQPHSRRFSAPVLVAPAPAANLVVSFGPHASALAAWQHTECSTLEPAPGPAFASAAPAGVFGPPLALAPAENAYQVTPLAAEGGGGQVSWVGVPFTPVSPPVLLSATVSAEGVAAPATTPTDGLVAVARDTAGDLLLEDLLPTVERVTPTSAPTGEIAVQPRTAATVEPAPMVPAAPLAAAESSFTTAVPVSGRAVALAWSIASGGLVLAVWRPPEQVP